MKTFNLIQFMGRLADILILIYARIIKKKPMSVATIRL